MALNKHELRILLVILQRMNKVSNNYESCSECGTIHEINEFDDLQFDFQMEIIDHPSNRQIAVAMESFIIERNKRNEDDMIFEAGQSKPGKGQRKMIYFNSYYMFEYLMHRIKEESE
ncbi:MAG: hypothetical protein ACTSW7_00930 [Candidatus Thorarchaeota archaeon]|nr:hypothetical protein [Thermoplasmatales archaeon]